MQEEKGLGVGVLAALGGAAALFGALVSVLLQWPSFRSWIALLGALLGHFGGGIVVSLILWEPLGMDHPTYWLAASLVGGFVGMLILLRLGFRWIAPAVEAQTGGRA